MEANELTSLNVGANFQVEVTDITCPEIVTYLTEVQAGDTVQIYPHTVNPYEPATEPRSVAGRKIKEGSPYGPFIIFPLRNLALNEEQKKVLQECNYEEDKKSYLTRLKGGLCQKVLERATGLSAGCRVQYYPYTLDLSIEESGSSPSLSPILIAVRKLEKNIVCGDFHFVNINDLSLDEKQTKELRGIIMASINDLLKKSAFKSKDIKYLMKRFSKKINLFEEDIVSYLEEDNFVAEYEY